jgi:isopenicillin N synthase-like dioxygenase
MTMDGALAIPVIDLGSARAATRIADACEQTGFLVVTNHGVEQAVIDSAWAATTRFFDLAIAAKMSVANASPHRSDTKRLPT